MKVLLTGARGFLGRHVFEMLSQRGIDTVTVGRTQTLPGAFIRADLLDADAIDKVVAEARATHLLHIAWYVEHGQYLQAPVNFRWAESTLRLTEAFCKSGGQGVVAAGTCFEYARSDAPAQEDTASLRPDTLYGAVKDATRRLVMAACAHYRVDCAWARIYLPYGGGEDSRRLIPSLVAALTGARPPFGVNRRARRDFLHAADVAGAFIALLTAGTGVYNIASGEGVAVEDVVRELAAILNADPAAILALDSARPGDPAVLVGDNNKLRALGWKQTLPLAAGLRRAVAEIAPGLVGTGR